MKKILFCFVLICLLSSCIVTVSPPTPVGEAELFIKTNYGLYPLRYWSIKDDSLNKIVTATYSDLDDAIEIRFYYDQDGVGINTFKNRMQVFTNKLANDADPVTSINYNAASNEWSYVAKDDYGEFFVGQAGIFKDNSIYVRIDCYETYEY